MEPVTKQALMILKRIRLSKPFDRRKYSHELTELLNAGYVESDFVSMTADSPAPPDNISITQKGIAYIESQRWFDTAFIIKSIVVPIGVSFITALLVSKLL